MTKKKTAKKTGGGRKAITAIDLQSDTPNAEELSEMNIQQRILWVRMRIKPVEKTAKVSTGSGRDQFFMAVTHDDVTEALRVLMCKAGIFHKMKPLDERIVDTNLKTRGGAIIWQLRAQYRIRYYCAEDPEDRTSQIVTAHANDNSDKGPGKLQSYGMKIGLMKMFMVETGEVEEGPADDSDDSHPAVVGEDEDLANQLHAAACELYDEENSERILQALARRRYQIEDGDWEMIPTYRFREAMASLKEHAKDWTPPVKPEDEDQTGAKTDVDLSADVEKVEIDTGALAEAVANVLEKTLEDSSEEGSVTEKIRRQSGDKS